MNPAKRLFLTIIIQGIFLTGVALAADSNNPSSTNIKEKQPVKKTPTPLDSINTDTLLSHMPVYTPPLRGAPRGRMGGGTRSGGSPLISALSPGHTGLTITAQPRLYFFLSADTDALLEFTLVAQEAEEPLMETQFKSSGEQLQFVDLSALNIKLAADTEYLWYITLVMQPELRAKDIVSGGSIQYIPASSDLNAALSQAKPEQRVFELAQSGIWYDAIMATQQDHMTRLHLTPLVQQAGIPLR